MRMPSVKLCAVFLTACALAGPASSPARADFINHFTGNVQMSDHSGSLTILTPQDDVSFTVYRNNGKTGNFLTDLGLAGTALPGSGSIDTSAKYVYMYQVFSLKGPVEELQITSSVKGLFTSAGYLSGSKNVFDDSNSVVGGGTVGTSGNPSYGKTPTKDDIAGDNNPGTLPTLSGFTDQGVPVKFGSIGVTTSTNTSSPPAGSRRPVSFVDNSDTSGFAVFNFNAAKNQINTGQTSVVVFLTSQYGPKYDMGDTHDGKDSDGDVPTAVTPEPGSFVLCGLGVGFLGFYGLRRRGLKAQPAVA